MKVFLRLLLLFGAVTYTNAPYAQQTKTINQPKDSINVSQITSNEKITTLQEVVVESATRKRIPQGIAFFPTKRERNFAADAINLIEIMALTELPYDYRANTVTTPNGGTVNYFIDGREATKKDLKALNPKDVERIEYFHMPTSGDFTGKKDVVNYVLKKYLTGGFTRILAQQYLNGSFGDYALSTRLAYKKVTLDGYFEGEYRNAFKSGSITNNTFKNFIYNSFSYDNVEETIDGRDNRSKRNDLGAFIRTIWTHRSIDLTATIGWNWREVPDVINRSATTYSPDIIKSSFVSSQRSSLYINPYAKIITKLKLPRNQTLTLNLIGEYLSERSSYLYSPQNLTSIFNGTRGKDRSVMGLLSYDKTFNAKNSLGISASIYHKVNNIDYSGSYDGTNKYENLVSYLSASYSHTLNKETSISVSGGVSNSLQYINGNRTSMWNPEASVSLSHDWNEKSSFNLSSNAFLMNYPGSYLNDITLRATEILWKRGNANLKNRLFWQSSVSNTWNLTNKFSFTLNGLYTHIFNKDFKIWIVEPERDGIIETMTDDGAVDWLRGGTKLTYKLFNKKLVLTGSFDYDFYKFSGIYRMTKSYVKGSMSAVWYGNNWYVGVVIVPGTMGSYYDTNVEQYKNWIYRMNLGYTYKQLNLRASIVNPFGDYLAGITRVSTEHFVQNVKNYSCFSANSVYLTAIYTLSYGKKVSKPTMNKSGMHDSGAMTVD